jgi:hypothetical protein
LFVCYTYAHASNEDDKTVQHIRICRTMLRDLRVNIQLTGRRVIVILDVFSFQAETDIMFPQIRLNCVHVTEHFGPLTTLWVYMCQLYAAMCISEFSLCLHYNAYNQ